MLNSVGPRRCGPHHPGGPILLTFEATRDAASGVAARYYMNRNFFVADPDAFTVSTQTVDDQSWHGGQRPLTLDEAKVSIALSAVSGGMFEIGDDLPTLGASPERVALVKNSDLIDMARLGRASTPLDLLSYAPSDQQPSIFLLKENAHQAMLTVFNWTEQSQTRALDFAQLGLKAPGSYKIVDVLGDEGCCEVSAGTIKLTQKPRSVRMLELVDNSVPAIAPPIEVVQAPSRGTAGEILTFQADAASPDAPVLACHWDFGDGTSADGIRVQHAYTGAGDHTVAVTVTGVGFGHESQDSRSHHCRHDLDSFRADAEPPGRVISINVMSTTHELRAGEQRARN